ncbi:MAG TPA: TRAP transporter small permease [Burkholderiales bacterium]|nr:TRAP transporter small permease [Burkholderiales bacterium]
MQEGAAATESAPGSRGLLYRAVEAWAILGGLILLGVVLMTTWSATSGVVISRPLPGDVELTEMLVAVAVFMFLPWCQYTGANVTADIFTQRAGPRAVAVMSLLAAVAALAFSVLLIWRMYAGLLDYREYVETTTILHIPIWYAYVPALASLALLVIACAGSLRLAFRDLRAAR